jgi:hypothetical protein
MRGIRMWLFSGMSLARATWLSDIANIVLIGSLVCGVVSTYLIVRTASVKEEYWDRDRRDSSERIATLTTRADELRRDTAAANERAAIASQRAAEADQKAAEAQLQLIKFREPRRSVLKGNTTGLIDKLKPFAGTQFDCAFDRSSGEQADFWWDLQPVLISSGWINVPWKYGTSSGGWSQGGRPETGEVAATNVEIHLLKEQRQRLAPAAVALISALNDIGIEAKDAGFNVYNSNAMAIHILIGEKR